MIPHLVRYVNIVRRGRIAFALAGPAPKYLVNACTQMLLEKMKLPRISIVSCT